MPEFFLCCEEFSEVGPLFVDGLGVAGEAPEFLSKFFCRIGAFGCFGKLTKRRNGLFEELLIACPGLIKLVHLFNK